MYKRQGNGCVFVEYRHLFGSISFCKDGYVDAFGRIAALQQIFMWCDVGSTLSLIHIYGNSPEKVAQVTSDNALKVFGMLK